MFHYLISFFGYIIDLYKVIFKMWAYLKQNLQVYNKFWVAKRPVELKLL